MITSRIKYQIIMYNYMNESFDIKNFTSKRTMNKFDKKSNYEDISDNVYEQELSQDCEMIYQLLMYQDASKSVSIFNFKTSQERSEFDEKYDKLMSNFDFREHEEIKYQDVRLKAIKYFNEYEKIEFTNTSQYLEEVKRNLDIEEENDTN